eukprot:Nk52_evm47s207 gene=Nk52_evmTU47s207
MGIKSKKNDSSHQPTLSHFFSAVSKQRPPPAENSKAECIEIIAEVENETSVEEQQPPLKRARKEESSIKKKRLDRFRQFAKTSHTKSPLQNEKQNAPPPSTSSSSSFVAEKSREENVPSAPVAICSKLSDQLKRYTWEEGGFARYKPPEPPLTPLEQQFADIKKSTDEDAVLFVECGYKYRFFGRDAEIAAQELDIMCFAKGNFLNASVPTTRLPVHVRRLVNKGYKVGVVSQVETAAIKAAGDNKSAPFTRELTALYTKGTMINDDMPKLGGDSHHHQGSNTEGTESRFILCLCEEPITVGTEAQVKISLVAVDVASGEINFDEFTDTFTRNELHTRFSHLRPCEIIYNAENKNPSSARTIAYLDGYRNSSASAVRMERRDSSWFTYSACVAHMCDFFQAIAKKDPEEKAAERAGQVLDEIINLSHNLVCCFSVMIKYLEIFKLASVFVRAPCSGSSKKTLLGHFRSNRCLQLPGNTVSNLELFECTGSLGNEYGSLIWALDRTRTPFGKRLLRKWVSYPLVNAKEIQLRQTAVQEIVNFMDQSLSNAVLEKLDDMFAKGMTDLERGLSRIYYGKCTPEEFLGICLDLKAISDAFAGMKGAKEQSVEESTLLKSLVCDIVIYAQDVNFFVEYLNRKAVFAKERTNLFDNQLHLDCHREIKRLKHLLKDLDEKMQTHLAEVRQKMKKTKNVDLEKEYKTILGMEYLIEVRKSKVACIPKDWMCVSSTKALSRFHTPFVTDTLKEINQARELLSIECEKAWKSLLAMFAVKFDGFRRVVDNLAVIDCLYSLAKVSSQPGYAKPCVCNDEENGGVPFLNVVNGRHPVVSHLYEQGTLRSTNGPTEYVPNNVLLNTDGCSNRCIIITGPNMGGKSSYVRQCALFVIMAQIGCFLPCSSARVGIFDSVFSRMGASDNFLGSGGESTFMVELKETSEILMSATARSLVILDELGRGTSTHDGVAIAFATLSYLIETIKCPTFFVTHFPLMVTELKELYPNDVMVAHMSFIEEQSKGNDYTGVSPTITFLYELVAGVAGRSYGLNVARLAGVPTDIISRAAEKSALLEQSVQQKLALSNSAVKARNKTAQILSKLKLAEKEQSSALVEEVISLSCS